MKTFQRFMKYVNQLSVNCEVTDQTLHKCMLVQVVVGHTNCAKNEVHLYIILPLLHDWSAESFWVLEFVVGGKSWIPVDDAVLVNG